MWWRMLVLGCLASAQLFIMSCSSLFPETSKAYEIARPQTPPVRTITGLVSRYGVSMPSSPPTGSAHRAWGKSTSRRRVLLIAPARSVPTAINGKS